MSITFENDIADDGVENELGLFDDDDPFNLPPPLPPLSPQRDDDPFNQNGDRDQTNADDKTEPNKKRRVKRSPRPKLDEVRLCSDRGIPALQHICDGIKFKGKGHEASDLKLLMQRYEHWAHRLFPKFPFTDVVDQVENLGNKKLVQNCLKRIRRGEEDNVDEEDKSDTEVGQNINGSQGDGALSQSDDTQAANNMQTFGVQVEATDNVVILTPEMQERIRQNRERALAKRRAAHEQQAEETNTQKDLQTGGTEQVAVQSSSNTVIAQDNDGETEHLAMESNSSAQTSDVEMRDQSTETAVSLTESELQSETNEDTATLPPIDSTNENEPREDTEMENNETEGFVADADIVQNEENLPGTGLGGAKLDNDLLESTENLSRQKNDSDLADGQPAKALSASSADVETAKIGPGDETLQAEVCRETLPTQATPPTEQPSDHNKTTEIQSMEIENEK
ncbi:uncharacterized protein [Porites lutea]|uniref:uncharacterized protein n=1 Tax=Porites lutea TaxID=51062 RepID=UPI003CC57CA6